MKQKVEDLLQRQLHTVFSAIAGKVFAKEKRPHILFF